MSDVRFKCPHCGQMFEGATEFIGTDSECPSCGKTFRLEIAGAAPAAKPNGLMCYLGMFKRYVGFRGRSRRREFWWALFFNFIASFIAGFLDGLIFDEYDDWSNLFFGIYSLATLLPILALQVRRLHDTNKSGWWVLILPLPVVNLAYLVWLATDGDNGPNRFGPDPKGR